MGAGVGSTHITRYLLKNVVELLLLFTFLVGVARLWLWKHKEDWFTGIGEVDRPLRVPSRLKEPECLQQP